MSRTIKEPFTKEQQEAIAADMAKMNPLVQPDNVKGAERKHQHHCPTCEATWDCPEEVCPHLRLMMCDTCWNLPSGNQAA